MKQQHIVRSGFDLKWWQTLGAQEKLTVGMAAIIVALCGVCILLYRSNEKNKIDADNRYENLRGLKNLEIAKEKARGDAAYESFILYMKNNETKYQELFFETQRLKVKLDNENTGD